MSNRIRLIFHCALEGCLAHVGRKALQAMENFAKPQTKAPAQQEEITRKTSLAGWEWIGQKEWLKRGKPEYRERSTNFSSGAFDEIYIYKVKKTTALPAGRSEVPVFKNVVERAKYLWEALPAEVRIHSRLVVTRENRHTVWRNSKGNPRFYGWKNIGKFKPPAITPEMAQATTSADLLWAGNQEAGHAPGNLVFDSDGNPVFMEPALTKPAPSNYEKELLAATQAKKVKSGLKFAFQAQSKKYKPPPVPQASQGDVTENAATPGQAKAGPQKPRLKIGVWA